MKKRPEDEVSPPDSLLDKIIGLSESSGRKSYYPMLQQTIRELQGEIAERHKVEETLRTMLERITQQQTAIAEISTHPAVFHGRLSDAAPMMTESMAKALHVDRASLWILHDNTLCCVDKFLLNSEKHIRGSKLNCADFPRYFTAISVGVIAASDAAHDDRAAEFCESYLTPHGIVALLDAPVILDGSLAAVVCFEQASHRIWQPEEITFAARIADQVALMLLSKRRRLAEEDSKKAHSILRRNLQFTEALLDSLPIPIFYKDTDLRYLGCNRNYTEVMGLQPDEIQGKTARDLWPDLAEKYDADDHALLQKGPRSTYEFFIRNKNRELREVILVKQLFYDESNQVAGIIGSFLDITEKNKAARENIGLRTMLSNIINSMPSILIGVDANGRVAHWNQQATLTTGIDEATALGQPLEIVAPRLGPEMAKIRRAILSKQPFFEGKLPRVEEGETRYEDVTIYPLITNGVDGAVIRIDDVTEKVRIEEMLIQSEKLLSVGGLAAGMAHEINNPLASIMGNTQVLQTRLLDTLPQNIQAAEEAGISLESLRTYLALRGIPKMLESIRASGSQAAKIVSNMLGFSRKSDSILMPEDIGFLLDKTLELARTDFDLKKKYDFKKIRILREYEENLPKVLGSSTKLQQVFLNLFRNGAEAMSGKVYPEGEGPCFTLRAYRNTPWIRIEIEDNGPGLEEWARKRVFEPFFTTKPVDKGTGLGLSVSYFIITEDHAGTMSVQTDLGDWTKFIIDLPASPYSK